MEEPKLLMSFATKCRKKSVSLNDRDAGLLLSALLCQVENSQCTARVFQVIRFSNERCNGSMELAEHLLSDGKLGIE